MCVTVEDAEVDHCNERGFVGVVGGYGDHNKQRNVSQLGQSCISMPCYTPGI